MLMKTLILAAGCGLLLGQPARAEDITNTIGGAAGADWRDGGGQITAIYKTGTEETATGNRPGNVLEFDPVFEEFPDGRTGWMFPQRIEEGINIAEAVPEQRGSVSSSNVLTGGIEGELALMVDGDPETALERKDVTVIQGMIMDIDLGARFGVSGVEFFPRNAHPDFPTPEHPFQGDFIKAYEILFNDGTEETQVEGRPALESFLLRAPNDESLVQLAIPPQYVRFVRLLSRTGVEFEIAEFRVFGTGYVPNAEYISNIYDMGDNLALWGNIRWLQESVGLDQFSDVRVRTRSGVDETPLVFNRSEQVFADKFTVPWKVGAIVSTPQGDANLDEMLAAGETKEAFDIYGDLTFEERNELAITRDEYNDLGPVKGPIVDDLEGWSQWSAAYDISAAGVTADNIEDAQVGVRIVSPGPRRYIQFRIEFWSDDLESATGIGPLSFTFSTPPPAAEIISEIYPRFVAELGGSETFTYAVMPTNIRPGVDPGFDHFEIETPVRVEGIESVEVVFPDSSSQSADFSGIDLKGLTEPIADASGDFAIELVEDRRFRVRHPTITESVFADEVVSRLNIRFRARVLRIGTQITGFAISGESIGQEVLPGNVGLLGDDDDDIVDVGTTTQRGLSVDVPISGASNKLLINVRAEPNPFSPNRDGANDQAMVRYDLARMFSPSPVSVSIHELSGRHVRELFAGEQGGGSYAIPWDGTNDAGQIVPPGIYIVRIDLDSDSNDARVAMSVALAY